MEAEDEICEISSNHRRSARVSGGAAVGDEGEAEADGAEDRGADVKQWRASRHQYSEREGTQSTPGDRRRLCGKDRCRAAVSCQKSACAEEDHSPSDVRQDQGPDYREAHKRQVGRKR